MGYYHPSEERLLREYTLPNIIKDSHTLYVIGAHRFDERDVINSIFPNLHNIYLFEPQPSLRRSLTKLRESDKRIRVFSVGIGHVNVNDRDLYLSRNDGASSSFRNNPIIPSPGRECVGSVKVHIRTLPFMIDRYKLQSPDLLFLDVEGYEPRVLVASKKFLPQIKMIYVEINAQTTLLPILLLLEKTHALIAFAPLQLKEPTLGNAIFINRRLLWI